MSAARPWSWDRLRSWLRLRLRLRLPVRGVFEAIHRRNLWGGTESVSGLGSDLAGTLALRTALPDLLRRHGIRRLLDLPCGDFHWMQALDLDVDEYIGADLIEALVRQNLQRHAAPGRRFLRLDLTRDPLPPADLVLCRDCLVHFSFDDIARAVANLRRSNSRYLLTTTFTGDRRNADVLTGDWRPLNLSRPPFLFPAPLELLDERYTAEDGLYTDKCLGLWRLADLPDL